MDIDPSMVRGIIVAVSSRFIETLEIVPKERLDNPRSGLFRLAFRMRVWGNCL